MSKYVCAFCPPFAFCVCVCVCVCIAQDNLIIDQPRQRRQTRRFGNNPSFVEEPEEEDTMELIPAKGKRGWTKLELQKVERYLLIFGWGQWARVLHSAFKGKKIRLSERDMENMCRTIVSPLQPVMCTTLYRRFWGTHTCANTHAYIRKCRYMTSYVHPPCVPWYYFPSTSVVGVLSTPLQRR